MKGYVCIKVGRAEARALEMKAMGETNEISCRERKEGCVLHPGLVLQCSTAVTSPVGSHKVVLMPDPAPGMGNSWLCAL